MRYTELDAQRIVATAERLAQRIAERFPGAGLAAVAAELLAVARTTNNHAIELGRPNRLIDALVAAIVVIGLAAAAPVAWKFGMSFYDSDPNETLQAMDAAMNIAVLVGLGILALRRTESRRRLTPALESLHGLRSLAHVIDMHQLTKDPVGDAAALAPTPSSPKRALGPAELARYLDYCSEMLSLIGKLAALYAQSLKSADVIDAVNDIEVLTSNLSRKIWQKIAIVEEKLRTPAHG